MRSMRSAQRQVELRQLGNQLPVLGKSNLLCKIVCVLPVCQAATLSGPRRAQDKDYRSPGKIVYYSTSCASWQWKTY